MRLPPFPAEYRASGLLLHVTSLPSPYGVGGVGPAAVAWVDLLHEASQCWWQALPLGPTGYGDSPYQSLSSFAGNPLLISPDWLIEDGLLRARDCTGWSFSDTAVDFDAVKRFKRSLAALAIAPLQDVLNLGKDARMNQPGSAEGNWRWRCTDDMLSASAWEALRNLTQASARSGGLGDLTAHDLSSVLSPEVTR